MLGISQSILDLNELEKYQMCQLITWANENRASILSLDIPSGMNGMTGKIFKILFKFFFVYCKYVPNS